jgi:prefoldin subunit 5
MSDPLEDEYEDTIEILNKEIASLKELIIQATPYVEYAVTYSTPLSQKLSEEWLEKTQERREK